MEASSCEKKYKKYSHFPNLLSSSSFLFSLLVLCSCFMKLVACSIKFTCYREKSSWRQQRIIKMQSFIPISHSHNYNNIIMLTMMMMIPFIIITDKLMIYYMICIWLSFIFFFCLFSSPEAIISSFIVHSP